LQDRLFAWRRRNFSQIGVAIGIQTSDGASTIRDNYIHDLHSKDTDPHFDGVTVLGRQNHVIIEQPAASVDSPAQGKNKTKRGT
jgi:hypothetical protein